MKRITGERRTVLTACLLLLGTRLEAQDAVRDTLPWTTRQRTVRAAGCAGRECSSVELAWPDFGRRAGPMARVNELLLLSLLNGEDTAVHHRTVQAMTDEFLRAARSGDSAGLPWDAKRTIAVRCNTPTRILLQTDDYAFTGGAHGTMASHFDAFVPATGARLSERDMVPLSTRAAVTPVAERAFRREREVAASGSLADAGFMFKDDRFDLGLAFLAVCGSSLFVHWNAYSIAPYALGSTQLVIPLDSVPMLRQ